MIRKTTLTVLLLVLFASVFAAGAFSVSETTSLPADGRMHVELTGEELRLSFTPAANSAYGVFFFPDGETAAVDARLYAQDGRWRPWAAVRCACLRRVSTPGRYIRSCSAAKAQAMWRLCAPRWDAALKSPSNWREKILPMKSCWCGRATRTGMPLRRNKAARPPSMPNPPPTRREISRRCAACSPTLPGAFWPKPTAARAAL